MVTVVVYGHPCAGFLCYRDDIEIKDIKSCVIGDDDNLKAICLWV